MSDRYREACPSCGTEMERYVPTAWHCPECERDYWKEGDSWWSCDVSGEPELVETATDGGNDRHRADEVTGEPVTVEWVGGSPWEVTVNPYMGAVIVNGRVYDVNTLCSEDVDPHMYREISTANEQEGSP